MRIWLVAAVLALSAPAAVAQQFRQKDFDAYVRRGLQTLRVPGVAVAVVRDGKLVFAQGYGVRTLGDTGRVDAHTLFQIASNTKAFTTAALAMLVDEGKLAWDDPVTKYLPDFQLYDPYVTREFTLRDLVTHRSGLGLGAGDLLWFHSMTESGTSIAFLSSTSDVAAPHGVERGQLQVVPRDSIDNTGPAGGIVSNVSDMAKWLLCRLDSGRYAGGRLFSERQARVMWAGNTILPIGDPPPPLAALRPGFSEYGLGWFLRDYRGRRLVAHTGGLAGMTSQVMLVPGERLGLIILTNGESSLMTALAYRLLDTFFGTPPTDWVAAFAQAEQLERTQADSIVRARSSSRDSLVGPSLPVARYAGTYRDDLYGDAAITLENNHLVLRFSHSPAFVGDLEHWQYDSFIARWRTGHIEDAYVTFALEPDGSIEQFKMEAVSPLADFSFDYQDLLFRPVRP